MRKMDFVGWNRGLGSWIVCGALFCGSTALAQKKTSSPPPPKPAAAPARTAPVARPAGTTAAGHPATGGSTVAGRPGIAGRPGEAAPRPIGVSKMENGHTVDRKPDGREIERTPEGRVAAYRAPGMEAHFNRGGRPDMIHTEHNGVRETIRRGPGGARYVETVHRGPDGRDIRVVGFGPHRGFVERGIYGRPGYVRRSFAYGGRSYAVVYRGYHYRGVAFYRPVPMVLYRPAFYGWAYQPWGAPVVYGWGWAGQPWYGAYGASFTPYPAYASMDQWMTDHMMAANLQEAYDAGRTDGAAQGGDYASAAPPPIPPDVKAQIDAEVRAELQEQQAAAATGGAALTAPVTDNEPDQLPDALKPGHTAFRVVAPLNVQANGQDCVLNTDDWITRTGGMDPSTGVVAVRVSSSRATDCAKGADTTVALNDLMTMQDDKDQKFQDSLRAASESMGKSGLPTGPAPGATPVPGAQAVADAGLGETLQLQQAGAAASEQQVTMASTSVRQ